MQLILRDYQDDMICRCRRAMAKVRRVLLQAPTGAGKTALASYMIGGTARRGKVAYFICHRAELISQTSATFRKFGIPHSFIASDLPYDPRQPVQICSIDTLKTRVHLVPEPDLAVWDECHHIAAAGWLAVMNGWQRCYHIGLSATPWRTDGTGLGGMFDEMVLGPTVAWLIAQGHLSPYLAFIPEGGMKMHDKRRKNEFTASDIDKKVNRPKLVGDIIKHWRKNANGLKSIGFGYSLDFCEFMVREFNAAGIRAAYLDGNTPKNLRRDIIRDYANDRYDVLWNRYLFGEGFDLAATAQRDVTIDCVIDAAPTISLSMAMQRWGRGLRPQDGKTAILLDHAGNMLKHGFPDDEREWDLADREKSGNGGGGDGPPPPVICEGCFNAIKRPLPPCCPHCGKSLRMAANFDDAVDDSQGLVAANDNDKAALREQRRREENAAKDLGALIAHGKKWGMKNPTGWALKKMANSPWRKDIARRKSAAAA